VETEALTLKPVFDGTDGFHYNFPRAAFHFGCAFIEIRSRGEMPRASQRGSMRRQGCGFRFR